MCAAAPIDALDARACSWLSAQTRATADGRVSDSYRGVANGNEEDGVVVRRLDLVAENM
jgi:hypothetical protein